MHHNESLRGWAAWQFHTSERPASAPGPTCTPHIHATSPSCLQVWEGKGVVASARKLIGATNPLVSEPGTIRGDYAIEVGRNVVHGSDSPENGEREAGGCSRHGNTVDSFLFYLKSYICMKYFKRGQPVNLYDIPVPHTYTVYSSFGLQCRTPPFI